MRRRGNLLTVITWGGLLAALGFALAGLSVQHLSAMTIHSNRQEAQNLARSVVSKAIERLLSDPTFCKTPQPGQILKVELQGSRPGAVGLLSFHQGTAGDNQIAYSVNNLKGTQPVPGANNRPVAPAQAQLIGEGRSGGSVRKVVAVLAVPPFPYAIAAAGPVSAQGGLTLGALEAAPEGDLPADAPLFPADLLSNFPGSQAIFLGANTRIAGDVKAAGGVDLDPNAPEGSIRVEGTIKSGAAPEALPKIPLSDYDPQNKPFTALNSEVYSNPLRVAGVMRRQGGLRADNGLALDSGLLFIDGDLTVHGGLSGKGVVVCTGKVTLDGQNHLESGNGVALLAGKDLSITGQDSDSSYFQGLVYTEGTFQANRVSIVGTLIAAGRNDEPVTLVRSRVLQAPERGVSVELAPTEEQGGGGGGPVVAPPLFLNPGNLNLSARVSGNTVQLMGSVSPGNERFAFPMIFNRPVSANQLMSQIPSAVLAHLSPGRTWARGAPWTGFYRDLATAINNAGGSPPGPSNPPAPGQTPVVMTINPSSFMRIQDQVRVVLWKEEDV